MLKHHLIHGFTNYEKRLAERGIKELRQTVNLLHKTLVNHQLVNDIGSETIQLIISYTKTWHLLLAYDEENFSLPEKGKQPISLLDHQSALKEIFTKNRFIST